MRGLIKWWLMAVMVMSLALGPLTGNWVQAADGDGDGSGGGQNNPLVIESTMPVNGAVGVADLEYIKIVFSKNVVYMTVRDKNLQCFSLWSGSQLIPAEIIMADDQIEREKRHDVLVKPQQPLQPGAVYRVEIAPEMQSKSGVTLGQKAVITFTMAGETKAPETVAPVKEQPAAPDIPVSSQPDNDITTPATAAAPVVSETGTEPPATAGTDSAATVPATIAADPEAAAPSATSSGNTLWWAALSAAIILGVAAWRRMGRKN